MTTTLLCLYFIYISHFISVQACKKMNDFHIYTLLYHFINMSSCGMFLKYSSEASVTDMFAVCLILISAVERHSRVSTAFSGSHTHTLHSSAVHHLTHSRLMWFNNTSMTRLLRGQGVPKSTVALIFLPLLSRGNGHDLKLKHNKTTTRLYGKNIDKLFPWQALEIWLSKGRFITNTVWVCWTVVHWSLLLCYCVIVWHLSAYALWNRRRREGDTNLIWFKDTHAHTHSMATTCYFIICVVLSDSSLMIIVCLHRMCTTPTVSG